VHPDILVSLQISAIQVAQLLKKKSDLMRNIIQFLKRYEPIKGSKQGENSEILSSPLKEI